VFVGVCLGGMCLCVKLSMFYTSVCLYICKESMYVYACVYLCMNACMHVCIYDHMLVCSFACMCVCVFVYMQPLGGQGRKNRFSQNAVLRPHYMATGSLLAVIRCRNGSSRCCCICGSSVCAYRGLALAVVVSCNSSSNGSGGSGGGGNSSGSSGGSSNNGAWQRQQ